MDKNDLIECINFFKGLDIEIDDITTEEELLKRQKVVAVKYSFKGKEFKTKKLYYKNIIELDNIKNKDALLKYFGDKIFWLDIHHHGWPQESGQSDLDNLVINDIAEENDHEFKLFLKQLANNKQTGYIQRITRDGRSGQYYHNLENNNHWHDLVILIKAIIESGGKEIDKKYFSRLVFRWDGTEKTIRERSTLTNKAYWCSRRLIDMLYKNIKTIQTDIKDMGIINLLKYKKQIILQGPPGTGKTFTAKDIAESIILGGVSTDKKIQKDRLNRSGQFQLIQFHPSYTYEDFVRGIVAKSEERSVFYKVENKIFASFIKKAESNFEDSQKDVEEISKEKWFKEKVDSYLTHLSDKTATGKTYLNGEKAFIKNISIENQTMTLYHDSFDPQGTGFKFTFDGIKKILKETDVVEDIDAHYSRNAGGKYLIPFVKDFRSFLDGATYVSSQDNRVELKNFVLVIDEINRANLPTVLGELIYALEYRGEPVDAMYDIDGDRKIAIPPNLYIIGTMNTADRSVGHIDYAIRRRFAFVDVLPTPEPIKEFARPKFRQVSELFIKNNDTIDWSNPKPERSETLAHDFRPEDVWIGHSYFITEKDGKDGEDELKLKIKYEVVPILKEYLKDGILLNGAEEIINSLND